jgi:hypothetical protein
MLYLSPRRCLLVSGILVAVVPLLFQSSNSSMVVAAEDPPYYHTVPNLPERNILATMGNPLKGLVGGSRWAAPPLRDDIVPSSLEFFNVGVSDDEQH